MERCKLLSGAKLVGQEKGRGPQGDWPKTGGSCEGRSQHRDCGGQKAGQVDSTLFRYEIVHIISSNFSNNYCFIELILFALKKSLGGGSTLKFMILFRRMGLEGQG